MNEVFLIGGMALVTFGVRYSLIGLSGRIKLPAAVISALQFVPPTVLTAIVVPAVLFPAGKLSVGLPLGMALGPDNARLIGALVTVLVAFWKKNLLLTIGAGMGFFLGYQMLLQLTGTPLG